VSLPRGAQDSHLERLQPQPDERRKLTDTHSDSILVR